jgi:hypothetical protein
MTDLEDLWESMPTRPAPTSRILALGRSRSAPSRGPRRHPLRWVATVAALGGAFAAGTLVTGSPAGKTGDPTSSPPAATLPSLVAFGADLSPADSCEDLLATYVDRGLGLVTADGWNRPYYYYDAWTARAGNAPGPMMFNDLSAEIPALAGAAMHRDQAKSLGTSRVEASDTGTNVQEEAVDEPDTAKSDGTLLVRLRDDELLIYDVSGDEVENLSTLTLTGIEDGQILLAGDTVIAVGADAKSTRSEVTGLRTGTRVQTIDIADPRAPKVTDNVTYEAAVSSVRQHGDTIRMVLSAGLPELPFVNRRKGVTRQDALDQNRQVVKDSTLEDWLPGYDAGDGTVDLLACDNVAVPSAKVGLDTAAVVTFSAAKPSTPTAFGLAGATTIAYESADRLYLASTGDGWACRCIDMGRSTSNATGTSYLFEFALSNDGAKHVASGEVEGTIRDRWSMDEYDGVLRVLVGPSSETGNYNSIVTLAREGDDLVETGRLDHLGANEQVQSVRWQDDLALVVTYRQMDPLYAVDLRGTPTLLSELKIPGFSSYLHPLGTDRMIGVGEGSSPGSRRWGAQMGLFDVSDLTDVKQLDVWHYRSGSQPVAGVDPRAFTWVAGQRTVLTVIQRGQTGSLSIQRLVKGHLENRMVEVEYGNDVASVRTIEMPDGRIVLVTGEDVEFLDL